MDIEELKHEAIISNLEYANVTALITDRLCVCGVAISGHEIEQLD